MRVRNHVQVTKAGIEGGGLGGGGGVLVEVEVYW